MNKLICMSLLTVLLITGCQPTQITETDLDRIPAGLNVPQDVYVVIEIPAHSDPVKYEMNKETGTLFVDRFIGSDMRYPANYGYIPHTLSNDGDPVDVLVITPYPVMSGAVLRVRPIALLQMEDEAGLDGKVIAVPVDTLTNLYATVQTKNDLDPIIITQIEGFFTHYKASEKGKWVKISGWGDVNAAHLEINEGVKRASSHH